MKKILKLAVFSLAIVAFTACNQTKQKEVKEDVIEENITQVGLVEKVLTKEEQDALTPDEVISILKEGNSRFMNNDLTERNHSQQVRNSTLAQYPKAIVLSCVDSRVPVEDVFDRGIGDMFVARVAGNFVDEDIYTFYTCVQSHLVSRTIALFLSFTIQTHFQQFSS